MVEDKTRAQNGAQIDSNTRPQVQACLPGQGFVERAQAAGWCMCDCTWCPPWEHLVTYCRDHCLTQSMGASR